MTKTSLYLGSKIRISVNKKGEILATFDRF